MGAIHSQAQVFSNGLIQGDGGTKVIIQKDLTTIGQDEEVPAINILFTNSESECRIESLLVKLKRVHFFN